MRKRHLGTCLSAGALALASTAQAQDFAVFEHDHRPETVPVAADIGSVAAARPMSREGERETGAPSYREALYSSLIRAAELRHGLPPRLLHSLVWAESRFNPMAISPAGAAGLAQLMPGTARALGVTNRYDPSENIDGGARYLRQMLDRFGSVHLALAAYNAGPGAVVKAGGIPRNRETPGYVRSVLDRWMNTAKR
jgi:soluble lytic murein transglycosylase-like protein